MIWELSASVILDGQAPTVKVPQVRSCHSRFLTATPTRVRHDLVKTMGHASEPTLMAQLPTRVYAQQDSLDSGVRISTLVTTMVTSLTMAMRTRDYPRITVPTTEICVVISYTRILTIVVTVDAAVWTLLGHSVNVNPDGQALIANIKSAP